MNCEHKQVDVYGPPSGAVMRCKTCGMLAISRWEWYPTSAIEPPKPEPGPAMMALKEWYLQYNQSPKCSCQEPVRAALREVGLLKDAP
jgi:hypothetical protein